MKAGTLDEAYMGRMAIDAGVRALLSEALTQAGLEEKS